MVKHCAKQRNTLAYHWPMKKKAKWVQKKGWMDIIMLFCWFPQVADI